MWHVLGACRLTSDSPENKRAWIGIFFLNKILLHFSKNGIGYPYVFALDAIIAVDLRTRNDCK